jgi:MFS family permease
MNIAGLDPVTVEPTNENVLSPLSATSHSTERQVSKESTRTISGIELSMTSNNEAITSVDSNSNIHSNKRESHNGKQSEDTFDTLYEGPNSSQHNDVYNEWLDPYAPPNRGIFTSYFAVGFVLYFILTPLIYYLVDDIDASPGQQSVVLGLLELPWALKILFGFITDSIPINGMRRKPHYVIGWSIYILSNIALTLIGKPNLEMVALFIFVQTMGFIQADVCMDAMIVERSKAHETAHNRGSLQAHGYICRFMGSIIGAICGAVLYNKGSWGWGFPIAAIFAINAFVPFFCVAPFLYTLVEVSSEEPPDISKQLESMWILVQRRAIWQPCTFIYVYNALYLTNPAWKSFLVETLSFSNFELGMLTLVGTILSYFGIVAYKKYFFNSSWRSIYVWTTTVSAIFSLFQLILVLRWNKDIGMGGKGGEMFFAMGSYGMVQLVQAVQVLSFYYFHVLVIILFLVSTCG